MLKLEHAEVCRSQFQQYPSPRVALPRALSVPRSKSLYSCQVINIWLEELHRATIDELNIFDSLTSDVLKTEQKMCIVLYFCVHVRSLGTPPNLICLGILLRLSTVSYHPHPMTPYFIMINQHQTAFQTGFFGTSQ